MRFNRLFRFAAIACLAISVAAGCGDDQATDPSVEQGVINDPNAELESSPYSIDIVSESHIEPSIMVNIEDNIANDYYYVAGVVKSSEYLTTFGGKDHKLADFIANRAIEEGCDFECADGEFVFQGAGYVSLSKWCKFGLDEKYLAVAFAVDADGVATTELMKQEFTTREIAPFTMTIESTSINDICVKVEMLPSFGAYYVAPIPVDILNFDYNGDVNNAANAAIIDALSSTSVNFDDPDNEVYVFDRSAVIHIAQGWNISSDTEYVVMAFGITPDGDLTSQVFNESAKTLPEVELVDGTFKLGVGEMEPDNVHVTVEKSGDIGNYLVFAYSGDAFVEAYYEYAPYLVDDITQQLYTQGFDFSTPDGKTLFSEESIEIDLKEAFTFYEGQSYVVMAVGVDEVGRANSEPNYIYAETSYFPEPEVTGSLEMKLAGTTVNNIVVEVEKIGAVNSYCVAACPMETFVEEYASNNDALIDNIISTQLADDLALPTGDRVYGKSGAIELGYSWPIVASTEYHVIAFGISRDKEQNTDYVTLSAITQDAPRSENIISIECKDITANSVTVNTTATIEDEQYYLTFVRESDIEGMTDEEIFRFIIDPYGQQFESTVSFYNGNIVDAEYDGFYANTNYYAVAFAYSYGSLVSEVFRSELFKTLEIAGEVATLQPEDIILSDVDFGEIVVADSFQYNLMTIDVKPADASMKYLFFIRETSQIAHCTTDQELIAFDYSKVKEAAGLQGTTVAATFSSWLRSGDENSKNGIYPSTEYTVYAYGVDTTTYQPVTAVEKVVVAVP